MTLFNPARYTRQLELLARAQEPKPRNEKERWQWAMESQIREAGLPDPEKEHLFAETIGRRWRLDYCWPDLRIALEIEGAVFGRVIRGQDGNVYRLGGRHSTGAGLQADCEKYSMVAILGWMLVRATTTMVRDGKAIALLRQAFAAKGRT